MTRCRAWPADITFVETKHGKLMPVDPDGTSHFATCPAAARFRKPAPPDNQCACGSLNVERLPGKGPHFGAIRCDDCGQRCWLRKPQEAQA